MSWADLRRGKNSPKPTKRRNRKPETLAFLRRALDPEQGLHPFDLPLEYRDQPPRRYKTIAEALKLKLDRALWVGNDQQANPGAVLHRVGLGIDAAINLGAVSEEDRVVLAEIAAEIENVLDPDVTPWLLWNVAEQRYESTDEVRDLLDRLERVPAARSFLNAAYKQLSDEYESKPRRGWPGALRFSPWVRQLEKELGDQRNLPGRLRDLTRNARERGDLPRRGR